MQLETSLIISAQVILKPRSGKVIGLDVPITSQNIREFLPSPEAVSQASQMFQEIGFEVGKPVATSFSITGPVSLFELTFQTILQMNRKKGVQALGSSGIASYELPLHHLPPRLLQLVQSVIFTPPPDFGPSNYI